MRGRVPDHDVADGAARRLRPRPFGGRSVRALACQRRQVRSGMSMTSQNLAVDMERVIRDMIARSTKSAPTEPGIYRMPCGDCTSRA